jgi:hypothetical protein
MFNSTVKTVLAHKEIVIAATVATILIGSLASPVPNAAAQINIDINDYLQVDVDGIHISIPTGGFGGSIFGGGNLEDFIGGFLP